MNLGISRTRDYIAGAASGNWHGLTMLAGTDPSVLKVTMKTKLASTDGHRSVQTDMLKSLSRRAVDSEAISTSAAILERYVLHENLVSDSLEDLAAWYDRVA